MCVILLTTSTKVLLTPMVNEPNKGCERRFPSRQNKERQVAGLTSSRELTLLAIGLAGGQPLTPVQLQKAVFLLQELLPGSVKPDAGYAFVPHNYGPFCAGVYDDARELSEEAFVTVQQVPGQRFSSYTATAAGLTQANMIAAQLPAESSAYARRVVDWVRAQSFRGLVSAIYERWPQYKVNSVFQG